MVPVIDAYRNDHAQDTILQIGMDQVDTDTCRMRVVLVWRVVLVAEAVRQNRIVPLVRIP